MNALVAFSISPGTSDESGSVAAGVAEAVRVVRESGLPCETNAMFTNVEGEWLKGDMTSGRVNAFVAAPGAQGVTC